MKAYDCHIYFDSYMIFLSYNPILISYSQNHFDYTGQSPLLACNE